ncbi:MAG TPA: hypothetical protein VFN25_12180 [Dokdonella sp.]|uniref:hypothetical protein n=1 Tax=Dokdonella sp. TaxID=2291710 RepID=UPI002D7F0E64|nr:hypothetical protein [Dokdonella sp.]HET9033648.1 hypothetical protein [Dokdonella sp.]
MNLRPLFHAGLIIVLLTCAACESALDKQQRKEEAINRGEVPAAEANADATRAFKSGCERAGGDWLALSSECAMTPAMCPSPGEWKDEIGCVFDSIPADECESMGSQGMRWVSDVCAITDISSEQFEQLGLGGEH